MDDILLTKYLLNETNESESASVRSWLAAHPDNERKFVQLRRIWEASKAFGSRLEMDEEQAWDRFVQRRNAIEPARTRRLGANWFRYAAAVILLPLVMWGIYGLWDAPYGAPALMVYETDAYPHTDTLTDGSIVTLNSYATLHYAQEKRKQRVATLEEGEVFFNVKQDPARPFVVHSGQVKVTVLGTSFHVRRSGDETEVIVESGQVKVTGPKQDLKLSVGDRLLINTATQRMETGKVNDRLYQYYVDNRFVMDNTPLWRIVEVLNQAYRSDIQIANPAIRDLRLTTTFRRGELEDILQVIGETLRIEVQQEGSKFILK